MPDISGVETLSELLPVAREVRKEPSCHRDPPF